MQRESELGRGVEYKVIKRTCTLSLGSWNSWAQKVRINKDKKYKKETD